MKKKLLMHICCAPCFVAPYYNLKDSFEISGFWYNNNIHPVTEYCKRRDTLRKFSQEENFRVIEKDEYGLVEFVQKSAFREDNRCFQCYFDRLNYCAIIAKKGNFDYFSTTLLYSKFQKHDLIKEIAFAVGKKHSIDFYYQDLRTFWKEGIIISKEKEMYRQQYCGCIYSEMDRFLEKKD